MDESRKHDIPQVFTEENEALTAMFSEKEVKAVIFQMKHNKSPGPDGFPADFFQALWEVIKGVLMALFKAFHEGKLPLFSLNFGIITLLLKQKEVTHIRQFQHICLLNVSFKIFIKVAVKMMTRIAKKIVNPSQTAFIPGRNIMEEVVVVLREMIHEMYRKKMSGVILKIDFEKAYDKVNWNLLQQCLRMKGFSDKWCQWINHFVCKGSVGVKVNENIGRYFQTKKV
jgi:hypothetical protein